MFAGQFVITTSKNEHIESLFSLLPICAHFPFRFGCNYPVFGENGLMDENSKEM